VIGAIIVDRYRTGVKFLKITSVLFLEESYLFPGWKSAKFDMFQMAAVLWISPGVISNLSGTRPSYPTWP